MEFDEFERSLNENNQRSQSFNNIDLKSELVISEKDEEEKEL